MAGKRRSRPAEHPEDQATCAIQVRVPQRLYDEIAKEAEENGRSLSAQCERRLRYSETHLTRLVAALVENAEDRLGERKEDSDTIEAECRRVAHVAVEVAFGHREGVTDGEIHRLSAARLPKEIFEQVQEDAWAPYILAEFKKNGGKVIV